MRVMFCYGRCLSCGLGCGHLFSHSSFNADMLKLAPACIGGYRGRSGAFPDFLLHENEAPELKHEPVVVARAFFVRR